MPKKTPGWVLPVGLCHICGGRGFRSPWKSTHHGVNNLEVSTKNPWYLMGEIFLTHNILHGFHWFPWWSFCLINPVSWGWHMNRAPWASIASTVWATRIHVPCVLLHMFASQTCQILGTFLHSLGMNLCVCVHMYICITTMRCFLFLLWLLCCSVCIPWCSINIKLFLHSRPAVSPRAPHTLHPLPAFTTPLRTAAKHRAIRENSVAISSHIGIWMDLEL